jgi:hypothetical protein
MIPSVQKAIEAAASIEPVAEKTKRRRASKRSKWKRRAKNGGVFGLLLLVAVLGTGLYWQAGRIVALEGQTAAIFFEPCLEWATKRKVSKEDAQKVCAALLKRSSERGANPFTMLNVSVVESALNCYVLSAEGAWGCMQVHLPTHGAREWGCDIVASVDCNVMAGVDIFVGYLAAFGGNLEHALLAYNRGDGTVWRALRAGENPSNGYEHKVLRGSA